MTRLILTQEQQRRLLDLMDSLPELLTALGRENLLDSAGLRKFAGDIEFSTPRRSFSQQLIRRLMDYGTFNGEPALLLLIRSLREMIPGRPDDVAFLNHLEQGADPPIPSQSADKPTTSSTFLSYSSFDRSFVARLSDDLEAHGTVTWWDRHREDGIKPSEDWELVIQGKLREVTHFVAILTPHSVASTMVRAELHIAGSARKILVPVLLETLPEGSMPLLLATLQYIDFRTPSDYFASLTRLATALKVTPSSRTDR